MARLTGYRVSRIGGPVGPSQSMQAGVAYALALSAPDWSRVNMRGLVLGLAFADLQAKLETLTAHGFVVPLPLGEAGRALRVVPGHTGTVAAYTERVNYYLSGLGVRAVGVFYARTEEVRSVDGLGAADALDAVTAPTTDGSIFGNGFLRGLLKLAVPVLVIGAGVALGHRWAGITREGNRRRNGKRRRRNPPYRVKGMAATLADARKAYDLLPAGYRSIVDHQAGRSYKKRKVVAESRRPR